MSADKNTQRDSINRKLREKLHELISTAEMHKKSNNIEDKRKAEIKIRIISDSILKKKNLEVAGRISKPTIFISYSRSGSQYFNKAKVQCEKKGFVVKTGFDDQQDEYVLKVIKQKIKESTLFLSIMTPEYKFEHSVRMPVDRDEYSPSIWLPEEKGMALALDKPFRLLVHSSIKSEFWRQTTPSQLHTIFSDGEFEEKLNEAVGALERRYEDLIEVQLQEFARKIDTEW